ncbi:citrate/2-methylcitrate synthase [Streptomyces sp. XH2]|uniref:citrate/2-methylcitrate synthase n=1 Tax=Streptomyces sp. XH2 TaxID=3412483 RepID=UPI003C7B4044
MARRKGIHPDPDYPSGLAHHLRGLRRLHVTPVFVMSRIAGRTAHVIGQLAHNALIQPLGACTGPDPRPVPA